MDLGQGGSGLDAGVGGAGDAHPCVLRDDGQHGRRAGLGHRPVPLPKDDPDWPEEMRRDWGGRRELATLAAGDDARFNGFAGRWLAGQGWVRDGDRLLAPSESLAVSDHAPSGFAWGYLGSGPSQLALASPSCSRPLTGRRPRGCTGRSRRTS